MPRSVERRRFPPPWAIDEHAESFIVRDATGQALGYFYFEDEPGRRSADVFKATAVIGCVSSEMARQRMTHDGQPRADFAVAHHAVLVFFDAPDQLQSLVGQECGLRL
jgi:PhoPQ-activated pathogenicity-related protein